MDALIADSILWTKDDLMSDSIPGIRKNSPPDTEPELNIKDRVDALNVQQLEDAWDVEASSWLDLGLNPATSIFVDMFHLKFRFDMLYEFIKENIAGFNEEEFDLRVKRAMLVAMITLRQQHERQMLHRRLTEGIQAPQVQVPILPPGTKI